MVTKVHDARIFKITFAPTHLIHYIPVMDQTWYNSTEDIIKIAVTDK